MTITLIVTGQGAFGGESLGAGNDANDAHGKLCLTKFGLFERNVALSDTPVQFSGERKQGAAIFRTGFNPFTEARISACFIEHTFGVFACKAGGD